MHGRSAFSQVTMTVNPSLHTPSAWQSPDLTYVPSITQCNDYTAGNGVPCTPNNPFTCTGRNPFCATAGDRQFKCCSDIIQDSIEIEKLTPEQIKPICPAGAIAYKMPHVMLCDPAIVNICPYDYKCVEASNGHLLPPDGRSLCCKTSTLYSFASVFGEAKISPRIVPNPPLTAIEYVTLNVHTSATMHAPEIRIGDHFVLSPYKLYEPAYLKTVKLHTEVVHGSYMHVLLFDPLSTTETMQFYYDRPSKEGKTINLDDPIPDGGFFSKRIFNAAPITNIENPQRPGPVKEFRKLWVVLVFKTVNPITRLYVSVTVDLHSKYKTVSEFLRSDTGRMLGTPVAGTYFYVKQIEVGEDEDRLVIDLFREYNFLIRPVRNVSSPPVTVEFGVAMILLINVDEKNQILQTNVWLTMKWNDFQLTWNPSEYGNISNLHVPSDRVWLPDIVLFNNADGNYEVSFKSNVFVDSNGDVTWVPPAMFKSSCRIDVEWFPFDEQCCTLVFGSWTYNSEEVRLHWYNNIQAVQLTDYSYSGIWDVIDVPGHLVNRAETKESKMVFNVVIRRKTLFYTVILIIPTVLMAFLSVMAFYLPVDSGEKISLTISLLLALVVFLLLVSKILPPTSNIPLMGKYLLLAFVLNIIAVVVTVLIVNIYFRSALSHQMPVWVRKTFLEFLPHLLVMKRPERIPIFNGYFVEEYCASEIFDASLVMPSMTATIVPFLQVAPLTSMQNLNSATSSSSETQHHENCSKWRKRLSRKLSNKHRKVPHVQAKIEEDEQETFVDDTNGNHVDALHEKISKEMKTTVEAIAYIAEHMKREMSLKKRLLLLVFFGVTLGGTLGIICSAPHVFDFVDQEKVIKQLNAKYLGGI
ncbi:unnamed protein product [Caenorhabditis auriculariae]|uniref:Uncharacterized protein n=1 Tax=Caenorhabditis auriculariae TaxID=2777116 RepID=A0A8S1GNW8_9PELO|nr:unnamed protein product [Caenorhabditis auriculariae]